MIAIVLHYVYMSTFAWTFVESLHVYHMLTEVRNIDAGPMRFYYVVGWGIPAIITGEDSSSGPAGVAWTGHPPPFGESAWRCRHRCPCQVSPRPRAQADEPSGLLCLWYPARLAPSGGASALGSAHTSGSLRRPLRGWAPWELRRVRSGFRLWPPTHKNSTSARCVHGWVWLCGLYVACTWSVCARLGMPVR